MKKQMLLPKRVFLPMFFRFVKKVGERTRNLTAITLPYSLVCTLIFSLGLFTAPATAQLLDCSFGTEGAVLHGISSPQSMAVYTSGTHAGKILVGYNSAGDFRVARFNADGTIDNTFGSNGNSIAIDFFGDFDDVVSVLIRSDDKIVLVGTVVENLQFAGPHFRVGLARFTSSGALDTSFGTNGKTTYFAYGQAQASHAYLATNNEIIVAGYDGSPTNNQDHVSSVFRFNETGGFLARGAINFNGNNNGVTGPFEEFQFVAPQGTKIISVGTLPNESSPGGQITVARWDGSNLDATFGSGGTQLVEVVAGSSHIVRGLAVQNDNKILIAVDIFDNNSKYNLIRLNANGGLDNTFGTSGVVRFEVGNTDADDSVDAMVLDASGRAILVGNPGVFNNRTVGGQNLGNIDYEFAAVRFNTSGLAETTFGVEKVNGFDQTGASSPRDAVLDANGKLLILGRDHFVKMEVVTNVPYCPALPCTSTLWYQDADSDSYGNAAVTQMACEQPPGYVANGNDCDDGDPALNPTTAWYLDADNDHYYTGGAVTQCTSPGTGYRYVGLAGGGDCNDGDPALNPTTAWYLDADNDNYYTGGAVTQCTSPGTGYRYIGLVGGNDCDDGNPAINPDAPEICDNLDNNCNNAIDDGINCCPAGTVLYVNDDAAGNNDGNSWANAFNDLQDALALANTCPNITAIWVAAGTYKPTSGTDRTVSFSMKNGVAILGGFPNTGNPGLADRNWAGNVTTISGDIGTAGDMADNSYHVISNDGNGLNNMAVLDGFTISGGNADDNSGIPFYRGGGMVNNGSSPTVSNCIFFGNYAGFGGGMSNRGSSFPIVTDCSFTNNSSSLGGGMHNNDASPVVTNCSFYDNTSSGSGGGMANFLSSSPITLTNCTFFGNSAPVGGGMFNSSSSPMIINCNFSGNSSPNGEGIRNVLANPTIVNSIFWDSGNEIANASGSSPIVKNSIIKGGYTPCTDCPGSNGNVDPFFMDASNGDLHLIACSPAINAGDNASVPTGVITDLDGTPRFFNGGTVDIGAYEFQGTPTPVVAICQSQTVNLDAGGSASLPASALDGGSTGCGTLSFEVDLASTLNYSCTDIGTNLVTLTVTDERGQTASCSTTVTVVDNVAPQALCQNITVEITPTESVSFAAEDVDGGSSAVCGDFSLVLSQNTFTCDALGMQTVTLTVTDDLNNLTDQCTATITVTDPNSYCCAAPVAICENLTVQLDASGNGSITAAEVGVNSTAECGLQSETLSQETFTCSNIGSNTVTYTITDINGDSDNCTANVTVEDNVAPVALCQNVTIQLDANGNGATSAEAVDNGSEDACPYGPVPGGLASLALSQTDFDCTHVGTNPVTLTVTDVNGNSNTCSATVTVQDHVGPTISQCEGLFAVFAGQQEIASATAIAFNANDACGLNTTTFSPSVITCDQLGQNVDVLVTVTDVNGNQSGCLATVKTEGLPCGFMDFGDDGIDCEDRNNVEYDTSTETFTLESNGCYTPNFSQDNAAYVQSQLCGDGEIIAHITNISPLGQGWAGITMRESEAPGAKKVELLVNLSNTVRRAIRFTTNGYAAPAQFFRPGATWLRLVRTGNQFLGYISTNGTTWQLVLGVNVPMNSCIQAGLMVTNYNGNSGVTGTFDQVQVNAYSNQGLQLPNTGQQLTETQLNSDFSLYPNPAKDRIFVDLENYYGQEVRLEIFNQLGQSLLHREIYEVGSKREEFDLTQMRPGAYIIRLTDKKGEIVKRFLITR